MVVNNGFEEETNLSRGKNYDVIWNVVPLEYMEDDFPETNHPYGTGFETLFAARIWQCIASIFADSLAEMGRSWPPTVEKQIYRVIVSILRDENLRDKV